jgi:hypothetical protein
MQELFGGERGILLRLGASGDGAPGHLINEFGEAAATRSSASSNRPSPASRAIHPR